MTRSPVRGASILAKALAATLKRRTALLREARDLLSGLAFGEDFGVSEREAEKQAAELLAEIAKEDLDDDR